MKNKQLFKLCVVSSLVLSVVGCASLQPPTRYSPCNNWGKECQWHKVNIDVVYPPRAVIKDVDGQAVDSNNANNGLSGYNW